MDILVKTHVKFFGRRGQGHEGVPGACTIRGARAKADIPFADALSPPQFGRVVMQRKFGIFQNQQQVGFLGLGLGDAFVEFIVPGLC